MKHINKRVVTSMVGKRRKSPPAKIKPVSELHSVLTVLIELFEIYGFETNGYAIDKTLAHWKNLESECGWMAVAKYKIAAFFSFHMGQPVPPCPFVQSDSPGVLFGGRAYRWVRLLRGSKPKTFRSLLISVLYSKKGMPRPGKDLVKKAQDQAVKMLTSFNPTGMRTLSFCDFFDYNITLEDLKSSPDFLNEEEILGAEKGSPGWCRNVLEVDDFIEQINRTVDELYPPSLTPVLSDEDWYRPRFPSTSANYNRSRSGGGAVESVKEVLDFKEFDSLDYDEPMEDEQLVRETFCKFSDFFVGNHQLRPRWHRRIKGDVFNEAVVRFDVGYADVQLPGEYWTNEFLPEDEEIESPMKIPLGQSDVLLADASALRAACGDLFSEVRRLAKTEPPLVEPVGLPEALKVRVISKGPPLTYTILQPLQKYLHSVLRAHPAFKLVGEPISEGYILERMGSKLDEDECYLSGDYKSSTDYLDPLVSDTIVERLSRNLCLPDDIAELFKRALTGHTFLANGDDIVIGERRGVAIDPKLLPQKWGQLMGSIVSFPVLCIANAALSRWALEFGGRKWTLVDSRLAINGDDVLMKCNRTCYRAWKALTSAGGLVESVGKCYFSKTYLNMNSTSYRVGELHTIAVPYRLDPSKTAFREGPFHLEKYVNLGLMYGLKRSGGKASGFSGDGEKTLGARAQELMNTCPEELKEKVYKKFLNKHWKVLGELRVPWFMPEWIGGVGLPPLFDRPVLTQYEVDNGLSDVESLRQREYLHGPTDLDFRKGANILLNFTKKPPLKDVAAPSWLVHKWVMGRMPFKPIRTCEDTFGEFDKFYSLLTVEALFRLPIDKLFDPEPVDKQKKIIRHNEKLWAGSKPLGVESALRCKIAVQKNINTHFYFPVLVS